MTIDFNQYRILREGETTKKGDIYLSSAGKFEPFEWEGLIIQKGSKIDIYRLDLSRTVLKEKIINFIS